MGQKLKETLYSCRARLFLFKRYIQAVFVEKNSFLYYISVKAIDPS